MSADAEASTAYNRKSIPTDLRGLLVKLEFLSMIRRGTKVNTSTMNFVESDSWVGAFRRMFSHENRRGTMGYVDNVVDLAVEAIDKYDGTEHLKIVVNSLYRARCGIQELIVTYEDDPEVVSHIRVCLENIDIPLERHKQLIIRMVPNQSVTPAFLNDTGSTAL